MTRRRALFALVAGIYVLSFPYHPGLRSPNELCRLWQTYALVDDGSLAINQALRDHGRVGDLSVMRTPEGPRYYPSKAPLLSFAAVPIYAALQALAGGGRFAVGELLLVFWSRFFLTVLPTLLMLLLLWRFLRAHLSEAVSDALVVTYALGSLAFSYSLLFMSHQTTAVLLFLAFYCLWRTAQREWRAWGYVAAGALAGAAVAAEYTSGLCFLALALYAALASAAGEERGRLGRAGKALGLAALGALPFAVALGLYHRACFGGFFETGYRHLNDAAYQPWHLGGFLGIRTPDPRAFLLSFFSPLRGLFALSPFLLLALPGLWRLERRGGRFSQEWALWVFTAALLLGYAYFTSSFSYASWGWTTGPRHMTGLVPFLLLPVGLMLEKVGTGPGWAKGLFAGLCVASILITGALTGVNYIPDDVSSPLFGLALPLFAKGYLSPTLLAFWGIPNPYSGGLVLLGVAVCAGWVGWLLITRRERRPLPGVVLPTLFSLAAVAGLLCVLALCTRYDRADLGAQRFLASEWLAPPGKTLSFGLMR